MEWRDALFLHFGPGLLGGATVRNWVRLLSDNRFAVSPGYTLRLMAASLHSAQTSLAGWYEGRRFGPAVNDVTVSSPVFVLGDWRSGTTPLRTLLAADRRSAFPSNAEVFSRTRSSRPVRPFPGGWASSCPPAAADGQHHDAREHAAGGPVRHRERPVTVPGVGVPPADGPLRPVSDNTGVPAAEIRRWRDAMVLFLQKLTWKYGRPLVLKSPPHTAWIRLLLVTFPGSKFVHIHRDPYAVSGWPAAVPGGL